MQRAVRHEGKAGRASGERGYGAPTAAMACTARQHTSRSGIAGSPASARATWSGAPGGVADVKDIGELNSVTVVVPVYNSAPTLGELARRLTDVLEQLALPYEILLVNDGSRDASWEQIV